MFVPVSTSRCTHSAHGSRSARAATFTQLASGNWRVQVRRKTRYVAETFRRRKDGEEWALEMQRNIDRNGSSKPRTVRKVRTFGALSRIGRDGLCPARPPSSCDARSEKSNRRDPQNRSASPSFAPLTSRPSAATCESPCCRPPVASPADCQPVNRAYRPDCEKDWCGHKHVSPSRARPAWLRHPDPHQDR